MPKIMACIPAFKLIYPKGPKPTTTTTTTPAAPPTAAPTTTTTTIKKSEVLPTTTTTTPAAPPTAAPTTTTTTLKKSEVLPTTTTTTPAAPPTAAPTTVSPTTVVTRVANVTVSTANCKAWGMWTPCSKTCGGGQRARFRMCGEKNDVELFACNTQPCPCTVTAKAVSAAAGDSVTSSDWWVEKDGKPGRTSAAEFVKEGSQLTNNTALHLRCNLCRCKEGELMCKKRTNCSQCTFSPWKDQGGCSKSCGVGFKVQTRKTLTFAPGCGSNSNKRTVACNKAACPCAAGPWTKWSACSTSCGGGTQSRSRSKSGECKGFAKTEKRACNSKPCPKGTPCKAPLSFQRCHNDTCPHTCAQYQNSSASCVERTKRCVDGCFCAKGLVLDLKANACVKKKACSCPKESPCGSCETYSCVEGKPKCLPKASCDCAWRPWSAWSPCSRPCAVGVQRRLREKRQEARGGGKKCSGGRVEERSCNINPCPYVCKEGDNSYRNLDLMPSSSRCEFCVCDGEGGKGVKKCFPKALERLDPIAWGAWGNWSSCAVCGTPSQRRTRSCHRPCPHDKRACPKDLSSGASNVQTRPCPARPCPINCQTVESGKGDCNAVCNGSTPWANGQKTIELMVLSQPKNGGRPCPSPLVRREACRKRCALVTKCQTTPWGAWSNCSYDCVGAACSTVQYRRRSLLKRGTPGLPCAVDEKRQCKMPPGSKPPGIQIKIVNLTCTPPMTAVKCGYRCHHRCEDKTLQVKCLDMATAVCKPGCLCPSGLYLQNATCKKLTACRCVWSDTMFGKRPAGAKLYYEPQESFTLNNCSDYKCVDSSWVRLPKACYTKCTWTPWVRGGCNASCDEGFETLTRNKTYSKSFTPATAECSGNGTHVVPCQGLACCHSQKHRLGDARCDITCAQFLNTTTRAAAKRLQSSACQNKCKCPAGMVLTDDRKRCILSSRCGKCLFNGTYYETGQTYEANCTTFLCSNGKFVAKPYTAAQMSPCSDKDARHHRFGSVRVPVRERCCYKTAGLKACGLDRIAVRNITIDGKACAVQNDVIVNQCRGGCPSLQKLEFSVDKNGVAMNAARKAICTCCRSLRSAPLLKKVRCAGGKTFSVTFKEATACECGMSECKRA